MFIQIPGMDKDLCCSGILNEFLTKMNAKKQIAFAIVCSAAVTD